MDVPWSLGFIVGAASTGLLMRFLGVAGILRLLLVVVGGICGGMVGDRIARQRRPPAP